LARFRGGRETEFIFMIVRRRSSKVTACKKQIDDAFHRQVWLKCGGYIVIDETEALVAIDVNTGATKADAMSRKRFYRRTWRRQMKSRASFGCAMSAAIIGDFIDMKPKRPADGL
jgi:ribonuclease G